MMKEPLVSRILRYALYAVFVLGAVGAATLPFMLDTYTRFLWDAYYSEPGYRTFILIFLMTVAVPGLWSVLEMIFMLRSIPTDPFVRRNVCALRRIGVIFLALALAFLGKCLVYVTFLTLLCGLLFIGAGLFAFTLAALIGQAIAFREENELTI
jgi:hypothetical protein